MIILSILIVPFQVNYQLDNQSVPHSILPSNTQFIPQDKPIGTIPHQSNQKFSDPNAFISVWDATLTHSMYVYDFVELPLRSEGTYDFVVDWGDGTQNTITSWNHPEIKHIYNTEGIFVMKITELLIIRIKYMLIASRII